MNNTVIHQLEKIISKWHDGKRKKILIAIMLASIAIGFGACGDSDVEYYTPPTYEYKYEYEHQYEETYAPMEISPYSIVVNGIGLEYDFYTPENETVPTHLPLVPIIAELGVVWGTNHVTPIVYSLSLPNGSTIDITDHSSSIIMDGEDLEMTHPAMLINDIFFVPISFFSEILGMESVVWVDGYVYLRS